LLGRLVAEHRASDEVLADFQERVWGKAGPPAGTRPEEVDAQAWRMLEESRVPDFEQEVLAHLHANSRPQFHGRILRELRDILSRLRNHMGLAIEAQSSESAEVKKSIRELKAAVKAAEVDISGLRTTADQYKEQLNDWIEREFRIFLESFDRDLAAA